MSHTFTQNHIHAVFSTKDRLRIIAADFQAELWSYMAGICRNQKMVPVAVGGVEDHAHLLFHLPPTLSLSKALSTIKANSSKWMNEQGRRFAWQEGYGAFSVSASNLRTVASYIRNQQKHHQRMSFEDEFITLLKKHGITFDPKYVFD